MNFNILKIVFSNWWCNHKSVNLFLEKWIKKKTTFTKYIITCILPFQTLIDHITCLWWLHWHLYNSIKRVYRIWIYCSPKLRSDLSFFFPSKNNVVTCSLPFPSSLFTALISLWVWPLPDVVNYRSPTANYNLNDFFLFHSANLPFQINTDIKMIPFWK